MNRTVLACCLFIATTLDKVFLLPFIKITSSANAFSLSNPPLPLSLPWSSSRTFASAPSSSRNRSTSSTRIPPQPRQHQATHVLLSQSSRLLFSTSDDFIDMLLDPPDPDSPTYKCTHMIAVPLEQNHDLLLELESIQRGILYHCPLFFEACVAPVVMRMPLLLIDTNHCDDKDGIPFPSAASLLGGSSRRNALLEEQEEEQEEEEEEQEGKLKEDNNGKNSLLTSRDPITQALHKIVKEVVQELIYTPNNTMDPDDHGENHNDDDDDNDDDNHREGENGDQIRPVMMKFQGLEIDGHDNEILHAIGIEDGGTPLLRQVVEEIAKRVEQTNGRWKAYLPQDRPQGKKGGLDGDEQTWWRPRIPFMRLPFHYWENLPPLASGGEHIRTPEEGGNGISPIFWYKWWDDRLCNGNGVRIRELAVYGRTGPMGTSEQAFYIPHLRVRLPDGNSVLQKEERNNEKYDKMRRNEQEMKLDNDDFNIADEAQRFEKQMANFKSTADRRMLQTVYDLSPSEAEEVDELAESLKEESRREMEDLQETLDHANGSNDSSSGSGSSSNSSGNSSSSSRSNVDATIVSPRNPRDNDEINTPTSKDIIRGIAKPIATGEWSTYTEELKKKKKPLPKDNPILQNWRKNRRSMAMNNGDINPPRKILAPYPSDEHFAGIWSIVSTPMGTIPSNEQDPSASTSANNNENLILRIDGSIAGGPILDTVNRHRAAGGTWKFFLAEWCGKSDNARDDNPAINRGIQTRLRIRLVIPPSKTKVLVMEGEVKRGGTGPFSAESVSKENAKELFSSSSFGLNRIAEDGFFSNKSEKDESFLFVSGEAWVEDNDVQDSSSSNRQKRSKLGRFAMVKKTDRHPNQYSYTIPPPTRYQD